MVTKVHRTVCQLIFAVFLAISIPVYAQHSGDYLFEEATPVSETLRNARRTPAGPVVMGIWTEGNADAHRASQMVEELQDLGIEAIIGFHEPDSDIREAFEANFDYHNFNFHWWRGWDEPFHDTLMSMLELYGPHAIAIHCQHGVDRAGNTMAFVLAAYYRVPIADAWYMMVANSELETRELAEVFAEFGVDDVRGPGGENVNLYGIHGNGMHTYSEGFKDYVRENIRVAIQYGASW